MKIFETTDKQHIGEDIDPESNPIIFENGDTMEITTKLPTADGYILANSNYIITLKSE